MNTKELKIRTKRGLAGQLRRNAKDIEAGRYVEFNIPMCATHPSWKKVNPKDYPTYSQAELVGWALRKVARDLEHGGTL